MPLRADFEGLLKRLEKRLSALEADSPLAGLRAVAAVERVTRRVGWRVAFDVDPDEVPWDEMGKALGISGNALYSRLRSYRPENSQSLYWADSGQPV